MANVVTTNPWILDTPGGGDIAPIAGQDLRISSVRWVRDSNVTAVDNVVVQDAAGVVKYEDRPMMVPGVAVPLAQETDFYPPLFMKGFKLTTLSQVAGTAKLYVYLDLGG